MCDLRVLLIDSFLELSLHVRSQRVQVVLQLRIRDQFALMCEH